MLGSASILPCHAVVSNSRSNSTRFGAVLPKRIVLAGLLNLRKFSQRDAHYFPTPEKSSIYLHRTTYQVHLHVINQLRLCLGSSHLPGIDEGFIWKRCTARTCLRVVPRLKKKGLDHWGVDSSDLRKHKHNDTGWFKRKKTVDSTMNVACIATRMSLCVIVLIVMNSGSVRHR